MEINVFELAFKENAALEQEKPTVAVKESVVKELADKVNKVVEAEKPIKESFPLDKIRFTEDTDEISSIQPDEGIVVVYTDEIEPEMTEEEVEQAAEDLIGATICKCGVCGANYIADEEHTHEHEDELVVDDDITESIFFKEAQEDGVFDTDECEHTCPICQSTENQVEVGEIAPMTDTVEDVVDDAIEEIQDANGIEDTEDEELEDEISSAEGDKIDADSVVDDEEIIADEETVVDEEEVEESLETAKVVEPKQAVKSDALKKIRQRVAERNKSIDKTIVKESTEPSKNTIRDAVAEHFDYPFDDDADDLFDSIHSAIDEGLIYTNEIRAVKDHYEGIDTELKDETLFGLADDIAAIVGNLKDNDVEESCNTKTKESVDEISFNESAFTHLLNKFVKENYENIERVSIVKGSFKDSELCFEGVVTTKSGKKRPVEFKTCGFKYNEGVMKLKMTEKGPFTESARLDKNRVPFVLECVARHGKVLPKSFKCKYTVKCEGAWYECSGKYNITENK